MFLAVTGSYAAIASEVGCKSPQTIGNWKAGVKTPNAEARARIEEAFGIPRQTWSLRPGGALDAAPLEVSQSIAPIGNPSTLEDCLALLTVIRRDRSQTGLMPGERVKLADAEARILGLRSRLEQAAEFAEARYVLEHPAWLRLRRVIVAALEPHPIAAKAVAEAIALLEAVK